MLSETDPLINNVHYQASCKPVGQDVAQVFIETANHCRTVVAGEIIEGTVHLLILKPYRASKLTLQLQGMEESLVGNEAWDRKQICHQKIVL